MSERGFTLAELLVAAALTLAAVALAVGVAGPARASFDRDIAGADLAQRLRIGLDALEFDVRAAGAGVALAETLPFADGVPVIEPGGPLDEARTSGGAFESLRLTTVPPLAAQALLREPVSVLAGPLRLASPPACSSASPACAFAPGDTALIFDGTGVFDIFEVAVVDALDWSVTPQAPLGATYAAGAAVAFVESMTYGLADDASGAYRLIKLTAAGASLPVLDHVVAFSVEPYGEAAPPVPSPIDGVPPTYGPQPPSAGEDDERDNWGAGENCTVTRQADDTPAPRLPWLGSGGTLVALTPEMLSDGPWCPGRGDGSDYDADLFRIRRLDIRLRVEIASARLRGAAGRLFARSGQGGRSAAWVPDAEFRLTVAPRNLLRP
jgi:hypothetical protein